MFLPNVWQSTICYISVAILLFLVKISSFLSVDPVHPFISPALSESTPQKILLDLFPLYLVNDSLFPDCAIDYRVWVVERTREAGRRAGQPRAAIIRNRCGA